MLQRSTPQTTQSNRWLLLILALQFALGMAVIIVLPLWQGHEQDYYNVVRFLTDNGRLPDESDYPDGDADIKQATQPPLFFIAAAPIVAVLDDRQPVPPGSQPDLVCIGGEATNTTAVGYPLTPAYRSPQGAVLAGYGLRVLNLLFGMLAVTLTYLAGRVLFPQRPAIALVGAALLAFEPNTLQMVTTISNDAPLLAIAAASIYYAARLTRSGGIAWRWAIPLMVTAALGILTRLSGWAVLGFALLVLVYAIGHTLWGARKRAKRGQLRAALLGVVLLIVGVIAIGAFNFSQYGTILGRYRWLDEMVLRAVQNFHLPWTTVTGVFEQTRDSYLSALNVVTNRNALLLAYGLLVLIPLLGAGIGVVVAVIRRIRTHTSPELWAYLLLIAAVGVGVGLVMFRNMINVSAMGGATTYNTATIFAPLRYYNAALPPMALLLSAGLAVLWEPVRNWAHRRAPLLNRNVLGIGVAAIWLVVGAIGMIVTLQARPASETLMLAQWDARPDVIRNEADADGDAPQLVGYTVRPGETAGNVQVDLYASITTVTETNYALDFSMNANGTVINQCQTLPARGFVPTTLWQPETMVHFTAQIPNCAGDLNAPVDLSLRWLGADMDGAIQSESPPVSLGTFDAPLAQAAACPQTLGILADSYRVTKFNSPESVRIGEIYLPSINWIVGDQSDEVAGRTLIFTHETTGEQYLCSAADHSAASWRRGEYVYFDRCSMTFPPETTPGNYSVGVVIVNAAGEQLSAIDAAGNLLPDDRVLLGNVRVER